MYDEVRKTDPEIAEVLDLELARLTGRPGPAGMRPAGHGRNAAPCAARLRTRRPMPPIPTA